MRSIEIYKRFLIKINKNDSNDGINILPSHFVLMFNTEVLRWLGEKLKTDGDNVKLSKLKNLLIPDEKLELVKEFEDSIDFKLPKQFYRFVSSYSVAVKEDCVRKIFNFDKKALGITAFSADAFSRPSFDYEETPCIVAGGNLKVYFDDFKIRDSYLTYYKAPIQIDIEGYERFDGSPSKNIDTELSDENIDEVLNRMDAETTRQYLDSDRFQFSKERIQTES